MKRIEYTTSQSEEFNRGVESVRAIRCFAHRALPQMNEAAGGDECAVCAVGEHLETSLLLLREVRAWRDSVGNEPFPHELRTRINELLDDPTILKAEGK